MKRAEPGYLAAVHSLAWWQRATFLVAFGACLTSSALPARAQLPIAGSAATESNEQGARRHFERALELYRAGRYAEALPELEQAARLDPSGKDLFFNLALVHEKLGQLPEAIVVLEHFRELETDPSERERARMTIERLRGAEQVSSAQPPVPQPCGSSAAPVPSPHSPASRTAPVPVLIGAASLAVVSAIFGTVFGLKAWSDDVSDTPTSAALPAPELRARARRSEREALAADVAFSIALASSATFVGVWLLSPVDAKSRVAALTVRGSF